LQAQVLRGRVDPNPPMPGALPTSSCRASCWPWPRTNPATRPPVNT
jgi:hypothetical protein